MIIHYLMMAITAGAHALGSVLPDASRLPTIGPINFDTFFSQGMGYIKFLAGIFPPLRTVMNAAIIYLIFKGVMLLLKLILGSRAPAAETR